MGVINVLTAIPTTAKPALLGGNITDCFLASPPLLALDILATGSQATANIRLYRYNETLGYWIPSALAAVTVDTSVDNGLSELRVNTAGISAFYALVRLSGTAAVQYHPVMQERVS